MDKQRRQAKVMKLQRQMEEARLHKAAAAHAAKLELEREQQEISANAFR